MSVIFTAIICGILFFSHGTEGMNPYSAAHERVKRQLAPGASSCLHIYTVPQQGTVCYPSQEVRDGLQNLNENLGAQGDQIKAIETRLDGIDPDKPKELPEDVKTKLNQLENVHRKQAGQEEKITHIQSEIKHVDERVKSVESADRLELARLIEMQSRMIEVAMHHSNRTLHTEYIAKLAASTDDLSARLRQLQADMHESIMASESKAEDKINQLKAERRTHVTEVKKHLTERMDSINNNLNKESEYRSKFQDMAVQNGQSVATLATKMDHVFDKQSEFSAAQLKLIARLDDLEKRLEEEIDIKTRLENKTREHENTIEKFRSNFQNLHEQFSSLNIKVQNLRYDLEDLTAVVLNSTKIEEIIPKVTDCQSAMHFFEPISGVYSIHPSLSDRSLHFKAYCQMDTDANEGWTLIMLRKDGAVDFYRLWTDYRIGFGDLKQEHWLGLENIHHLTKKKNMKLRVELQDWDGRWFHAEYSTFYIDDEANQYKLHVSGYSGDAGDSLSYHSGSMFSTIDRNNDLSDVVCATLCHGAWWYNQCYQSNLNGRFYHGGAYTTSRGWGDGIVWKSLRQTYYYSLKYVVMKVKPK